MNNEFGLYKTDIEEIVAVLKSVPEVDEAIVFGSRAKGNFRNGSDLDIAIKGKDISFSAISHLSYVLNEDTLMPYKFDILDYNTISNTDLKEHINRIGKTLYKKSDNN